MPRRTTPKKSQRMHRVAIFVRGVVVEMARRKKKTSGIAVIIAPRMAGTNGPVASSRFDHSEVPARMNAREFCT